MTRSLPLLNDESLFFDDDNKKLDKINGANGYKYTTLTKEESHMTMAIVQHLKTLNLKCSISHLIKEAKLSDIYRDIHSMSDLLERREYDRACEILEKLQLIDEELLDYFILQIQLLKFEYFLSVGEWIEAISILQSRISKLASNKTLNECTNKLVSFNDIHKVCKNNGFSLQSANEKVLMEIEHEISPFKLEFVCSKCCQFPCKCCSPSLNHPCNLEQIWKHEFDGPIEMIKLSKEGLLACAHSKTTLIVFAGDHSRLFEGALKEKLHSMAWDESGCKKRLICTDIVGNIYCCEERKLLPSKQIYQIQIQNHHQSFWSLNLIKEEFGSNLQIKYCERLDDDLVNCGYWMIGNHLGIWKLSIVDEDEDCRILPLRQEPGLVDFDHECFIKKNQIKVFGKLYPISGIPTSITPISKNTILVSKLDDPYIYQYSKNDQSHKIIFSGHQNTKYIIKPTPLFDDGAILMGSEDGKIYFCKEGEMPYVCDYRMGIDGEFDENMVVITDCCKLKALLAMAVCAQGSLRIYRISKSHNFCKFNYHL